MPDKFRRFKKTTGSIALTTMLVVMSLLLVLVITITISQIDSKRIAVNNDNFAYSKTKSFSCLSEVMYRLKKNISYTGTVNLTFVDGNCSAITTNLTGGKKNVAITSVTSQNTYTENKTVDTTTLPMKIQN